LKKNPTREKKRRKERKKNSLCLYKKVEGENGGEKMRD